MCINTEEENRNPNWKHRDQTQMVPNTNYNIIIYILNSANRTDSNKLVIISVYCVYCLILGWYEEHA